MGAATSYFFHSDTGRETLNKRVRPSDEQLQFLRDKKDALSEHLIADLADRCGCDISIWLQGSYKFHTLIRPAHKHDDYDVDVGVYFEWEDAEGELMGPEEMRDYLQDSMVAFERVDRTIKEIVDPPKERCSRAKYHQQFHIDTPAYHHNLTTGVARLATLSNGWEYSDPEKMVKWFQDRLDGKERAQVRRLVRYLKAWAALRFADEKEAHPSSLLLTILCVDAHSAAIGSMTFDDDDALRHVVTAIKLRLQRDTRVENPVPSDQDRNLNRFSEAGFAGFVAGLSEFVDVSTRATTCEDESDAVAIWTESFDYLFPLPDVEGFAEADPQRGLLVQTPAVEIDVLSKDGHHLRSYTNEVELVRIDERLRFRITNPAVLPTNAKIRWVVRNVGEHAYRENDLGHSEVDNGSFVHNEHVAYHGRHFMDCEVRVAGRIRSITRIPVNVSSLGSPVRNPRRPPYTRIGRRGR